MRSLSVLGLLAVGAALYFPSQHPHPRSLALSPGEPTVTVDFSAPDPVPARQKALQTLVLGDVWGKQRPLPSTEPIRWENFVRRVAQTHRGQPVTYVIWNTPDLPSSWPGTPAQFQDTYKRAARILTQEAGANAAIAGPAFSRWEPDQMRQFVEFCKASNARLDTLTWHEAPKDALLPTIQTHRRSARASYLDDPAARVVGIQSIAPMESVDTQMRDKPGSLVAALSDAEQDRAEVGRAAAWEAEGDSLSWLRASDHRLRSVWQTYRAYQDSVPGRVKSVSDDRRIVAFASLAPDRSGTAHVLLGFYGLHPTAGSLTPVHIQLKNLPLSESSTHLQVSYTCLPDSVNAGDAQIPTPPQETVPVTDGVATLTIPDFGIYDAYVVTIQPV